MTLAWWFEPDGGLLQYGDGRKPEKGITHTVCVEPALCKAGLHASVRLIDALGYAGSSVLWRVQLGGVIVHGDDKCSATERTYIQRIDIEPQLRKFARWCALQVIHLWDAPNVVRRYLETGDESLRAAAGAARDAAGAARDAARAAAWAAAGDAAAAAAWDAAGDAQNVELERLVLAALAGEGDKPCPG